MEKFVIKMYATILLLIIVVSGATSCVWYVLSQQKRVETTTKETNFKTLLQCIKYVDACDKATNINEAQWKIYANHLNTIYQYDKYRYDKLDDIFFAINKAINPSKSLHLAIKIYHPDASLTYHQRIEHRYNMLINLYY